MRFWLRKMQKANVTFKKDQYAKTSYKSTSETDARELSKVTELGQMWKFQKEPKINKDNFLLGCTGVATVSIGSFRIFPPLYKMLEKTSCVILNSLKQALK